MPDTSDLRSLLEENTQAIKKLLDGLENVDPAERPAKNTWSILDCLEHIVLTDQNILYVFEDECTEEERNPEEKAKLIRENFMDFDKRFRAFGPIAPQDKFDSVDEAFEALKDIRNKMIEYGDENGWDYLCLGFAHPLFGTLTRAEWIHFAAIHAKRHLKQMGWIKERMEE